MDFVCYARREGKLGRLMRARALVKAARQVQDVDVYLAVEPDSAAVAVRLARRTGAGVVFDVHEMWHSDMLRHWVSGPMRRLVSRVLRHQIGATCRRCDLVVGVGKTRLEPYERQIRQGMVIRHCLPRDFAENIQAQVLANERGRVLIMHGKGTASHGTRDVLVAALSAQQCVSSQIKVVVFRLGYKVPSGYGSENLDKLVDELDARANVDIRESVSFNEMFPILGDCDIGLIAYRRDLGVHCMPNRVFEYMAVGLPVIAPSYSIELADIIKRFDCGLLVDTEKPDALSHAITDLIQRPEEARRLGGNGRRAFREQLNWETEAKPLLEWLRAYQRQKPVTAMDS